MKFFLQLFRFILSVVFTGIVVVIVSASFLMFRWERVWEWWVKRWAIIILKILCIKVKILGVKNLSGPAIFIMNHTSIVDIMLFFLAVPNRVAVLAKKEVKRVPLITNILSFGGGIFVDRSDPSKAILDIRNGIKRLPKGYSIMVFPEGTRSQNFQLLPFKKGTAHIAIATRLPVVPIGYVGTEKIGGGKALLLKKGVIYMSVGSPIETSQWSERTVDVHTQKMRDAVQAQIDIARSAEGAVID